MASNQEVASSNLAGCTRINRARYYIISIQRFRIERPDVHREGSKFPPRADPPLADESLPAGRQVAGVTRTQTNKKVFTRQADKNFFGGSGGDRTHDK